jgi:uncharacterized protein YeaO (DUF488 family)
LCIGISRFFPKEFQTTEIANFLYTPGTILAPSAELLNDIKSGKISNEEYTIRYYQELSQNIKKIGFSSANEYFARMISEFSSSEWEAIVFMCYEKPDEFCHRHLLAALMRKNGIDVQEYKSVHKTSKEDLHSPALF